MLRRALILPVLMALFSLSGTLRAASYLAISDFTALDSGEVPYYLDNDRNALAINAANTAYRERFARAELTIQESAGLYDLILTTLKETDGDCVYRVSLNGDLLAEFVNEPTQTDYEPQSHSLYQISLSPGDVLAVESKAVSNGLIPEGDAFAYARGRWSQLDINAVSNTSSSTADLSMRLIDETGAAQFEATAGEPYTVSFDFQNLSTDTVVTGAVVMMELPDGVLLSEGEGCVQDGAQLMCSLPEVSAGESVPLSLSLLDDAEREYRLYVTVESDQHDANMENNEVFITVNVSATPDTVVDPEIDENVDQETDLPVDANPGQEATTGDSDPDSGGSGGGALGPLIVLLLGLMRLRRAVLK